MTYLNIIRLYTIYIVMVRSYKCIPPPPKNGIVIVMLVGLWLWVGGGGGFQAIRKVKYCLFT